MLNCRIKKSLRFSVEDRRHAARALQVRRECRWLVEHGEYGGLPVVVVRV